MRLVQKHRGIVCKLDSAQCQKIKTNESCSKHKILLLSGKYTPTPQVLLHLLGMGINKKEKAHTLQTGILQKCSLSACLFELIVIECLLGTNLSPETCCAAWPLEQSCSQAQSAAIILPWSTCQTSTMPCGPAWGEDWLWDWVKRDWQKRQWYPVGGVARLFVTRFCCS